MRQSRPTAWWPLAAAAAIALSPAASADPGPAKRSWSATDPWENLQIFDPGRVEPAATAAKIEPQGLVGHDDSLGTARAASADVDAPSVRKSDPAADRAAAEGGRQLVRSPAAGRGSAPVAAPRADAGWIRTLGSLIGVVCLIFLLGWGYRVVAGGGRLALARGRQPELLQVVARTAVSARQSLCLVRIGPRLVLVGVGPERLTALDVIADSGLAAEIAGRAARAAATSHTADFERCLEREARAYGADDAAAESATPDEPQVSAIKRTLRAAAARLRSATSPP